MISETITTGVRRLLAAGAVLASLLARGGLQAQSGKKMDRLIVYGEGFSSAVKDPDGWQGDTSRLASKYQVNVVFLPSAQESRNLDVTIRVRISQKQDENTIEDLNYDMRDHQQKYPDLRRSPEVTHPCSPEVTHPCGS